MSIAIKKFMAMLEEEINSKSGLSESQKNVLKKVCEKVYVLENTDANSLDINSKIRDEVKFYADDFKK